MASVRDYMDPDPITVSPAATLEEVARTIGENELPGVPVVDADRRVVGVVSENDLVISDDEGDLHIPHYVELFGGLIFLEPFRRFEQRLKKPGPPTAEQMMTAAPRPGGPDDDVHGPAHLILETGHNRIPVVEDGRLV